jgi:hypothetical protein
MKDFLIIAAACALGVIAANKLAKKVPALA